MTAIQLRTELLSEISPMLDDESLMQKVLLYIKSLKASKQETIAEQQQKMVKESLTRAFDELKQAQRGEKDLKTADEFIKEFYLRQK